MEVKKDKEEEDLKTAAIIIGLLIGQILSLIFIWKA